MESCSDDSFIWSNTSSDTTDSDAMNVTNTTKNQSDVESEYGNSYKKKLQKDLFSNNDENKVTDESPRHKNRKRKSHNEQPDEESMESSKKKKIKVEPESDLDTSKNKRAHNKSNISNNQQQVTSDEERYLNIRVKQEDNFTTPSPVKSKKKKRKSGCDTSTQSANESENDNTKAINNNGSVYQANGEASDINHSIDPEETRIKVKKKKKKSKRRTSSESDMKDDNTIIEDKFTAEETVVDRHQVNGSSHLSVSGDTRKKKQNSGHQQKPINNSDSRTNSSDESTIMQGDEQEHVNSSKSIVNDSCHVDAKGRLALASVASSDISVIDDSHIPEKTNQRVSRISDRIRFEDEHNDDLDVTENNDIEYVTNTKKFKKFLKNNPDLKQVKHHLPNGTVLTPDDDIWMIRCPRDIDVTAFQGLNLNLDNKCKVKIGEQTYEGGLNEELGRIPVLSLEQKELVIKNLPQIGTLNLRKRVPKAHVRDDNVMVNNQTDFIPLPETKCRHPLFGPNYKRAIKIPKAVAKRLNVEAADDVLTANSEPSRKKKHKKDRRKSQDFASDTVVKPKFETEPEQDSELVEGTKKTSKKRKHEHHEESPPSKKSKRAKHKQGSMEVWESEKAIEENLFNF